MTRVLIWPTKGWDSVAILADTRLSGAKGPLTQNTSKILSLPIHLRERYEDEHGGPPRTEEVFASQIAFAFAGSSLSATSTFSYAATVLRRLVGWEGAPCPTGQDVADFIARIGTRYVRDIAAQQSGAALFEAGLVMVDPTQRYGHRKQVQIFHLRGGGLNPYVMKAERFRGRAGANVLVLGENSDAAHRNLVDALGQDRSFDPRTYLQSEIDSGESKTIGGRIHQAHVDQYGLSMRPLRLLCEHGQTISEDSASRVGAYSFSTGVSGDW